MEKSIDQEPGANCEVTGCHQRDFLPFKCDLCFKIVCLAHKTYAAHSCVAGLSKDMTSLDCPVCGVAIKFSKAEDADAVWQRHYTAKGCKPKSVVAPKKCPCCISILGPSNTWNCPKCSLDVCLTHRLPEDHHCKAINGNNRIPPLPSNPKVPTTNPTKYTAKRSIQPPSQYVGENSLRGSTERRMALAAAASAGNRTGTSSETTAHTCPRCGERFVDAVLLVSHFEVSHPDGNNNSNSSSSSSGGGGSSSSGLSAAADLFTSSAIAAQNAALSAFNSATRLGQSNQSPPPSTPTTTATTTQRDGLGREVCPICSRRFVDAAELVVHYQTAHDTTPSSSANHNSSNSTPQIFSGQDCTLS